MQQSTRLLTVSLIACAVPGALVALAATFSAVWGWGGLSFSSPIYYLILAVAAWCPVSKLLVWRFWQRQAETCLVCVPGRAIERCFTTTATVEDLSSGTVYRTGS